MLEKIAMKISRFAIIGVFLIPFLGSIAWADHPEDALEADKRGILNIQLENDLWGNGEDRHYTHGTRISYLSKEKLTDFEGSVKSKVHDFLPEFLIPDANRLSFVLGQNMFTPEDISTSDLIEDDRPYAGWLYAGVGLISEKRSGHGRPFMDNLEINVGVVGPWALGDETQTTVHRLKGVQVPRGWSHQLENEPGFVLFFERKWPETYKVSVAGLETDFTPSAGFALGNVYTYGALGATVRVGWDLPSDYGPPRVRPGLSGSGFFKPSKKFGWYIFAGVEGRAMGRNIFLDGNTFADSHSVDKKTWVGDLQAGIVITAFEHFRFGFTNIFRTKEFDGQGETDEFGSINMSIRW